MAVTVEQIQQRIPPTVRYESRANALVFKPDFEAVKPDTQLLLCLTEGYDEYLDALKVSLLSEIPAAFHTAFVNSFLPEKFAASICRVLSKMYELKRSKDDTTIDEMIEKYQPLSDDEAPRPTRKKATVVYPMNHQPLGLEFLQHNLAFRRLLITQLSMRLKRFRHSEGFDDPVVLIPQLENDESLMNYLPEGDLLALWFTDDDEFMDFYCELLG